MKRLRILAFSAVIFSFSCGDSTFPGFDKTESGLYYSITESEEEGALIKQDDIITIDLKYMTDDTVLYDSKLVPYPTQLKVGPPAYAGDVMEGFTMLKVGDEATFKTRADSFFSKIANIAVPDFIDSNAYLTFEVKVTKSQSYEELMAEKQAEAATYQANEKEFIQAYMTENNLQAEAKESGLYFIETAPGNGQIAARGSIVKVHYLGRLTSGEKFDSSYDRDEPIEFTLGSGQVIPGWDEGIGYMTVGSKATLIIPSHLAYGDSPPPGSIIKPYSTLVFDVELLEVK